MMSNKSPNMLRTRRRDINIKPNRRDSRPSRLDRKSSRGMIYENEELRLRTININAEIERGQYDIKKLKRENEMLKKEIWCLRDEYEKLDKLLKEKEIDFSSTTGSSDTSCTSDTESCSSCTSDDEDQDDDDNNEQQVEQSQNLENVQKTTNMQQLQNYHLHHHYLHDFDHLSVVVEETENSDKNSNSNSNHLSPSSPQRPLSLQTTNDNTMIIKPDQSYPIYVKANTLPSTQQQQQSIINTKLSKSHDTIIYPNQFYHEHNSGINNNNSNNNNENWTNFYQLPKSDEIINKTTTDLIVKTDNKSFNSNNNNNDNSNNNTTPSRSTFSNGGNLEELLNDIETISKDILQITNQQKQSNNDSGNEQLEQQQQQQQQQQKPFKSELNVVLMPNPMPLIGFEKYEDLKKSLEDLHEQKQQQQQQHVENPFIFDDYFNQRYNPENFENFEQHQQQDKGSKTNLLELSNSDIISSENDENLKMNTVQIDNKQQSQQQQEKLSIRRKVSIHFKGKKDKNQTTKTSPILEKKSTIFGLLTPTTPTINDIKHQKTPSVESKKSTTDNEPKTPTSSDSKIGIEFIKKQQKQQRKSSSISPERLVTPTTTTPTTTNNNQNQQQQQQQQQKQHEKKHKRHKKLDKTRQLNKRRDTISSIDNNNLKLNRERSFSVCTERSNIYNHYRERTNSLSSCDTTIQNRKMSTISNIPLNGKVPWCACWGNGCI